MKLKNVAVALPLLITAACAGETAYFYRRTMKRSRLSTERTMKMAGTDWSRYSDMLQTRKKYFLEQLHRDVYISSRDNLKLHATFFPRGDCRKIVICFHGYTSSGMSDYIALSDYYFRNGYSMLLPDARAHGESEGEYVGFGCLDRWDAMEWIKWVIKECGPKTQILLHGTSMGGATVLMTSALKLPGQVKGVISDCAFTSPKYVFTHVLHTMYHLPAFPVIPLTDCVNRIKAGYGMDECNAAREISKTRIPVLMIHGDADNFVPVSMCHEIYANCNAPKTKLIIKGASHAESYYKDTKAYEAALDKFINNVMN
ncbi:MAG: alpha/beta hydrolase [Butyrivibrio sp.]